MDCNVLIWIYIFSNVAENLDKVKINDILFSHKSSHCIMECNQIGHERLDQVSSSHASHSQSQSSHFMCPAMCSKRIY